MPFLSRRTILLLTIACRASYGQSQFGGQPAFSVSPAALLAQDDAASGKGAFDAVVLLDEERWVFAKDGKFRHSFHSIYRVLTAQGVEEWSSLEWRWEPWRQKRPVIRARVVTADGVVHTLDQKTVVDSTPAAGDNNMYSDVRTVRCPLPAVAAGSVVEEEIEEETSPALPGEVERIYPARSVPVREMRASLEYPDSLPVRYSALLLPDLKTTKSSENGTTHLLFSGTLAPMDEIEQMLPPDVPREPQIIFSTGDSWKSLAVAYNNIVETQIAGAPVADIVKRVVAAQDRAQIISLLNRELHKEIRYTGVEFGEAAIIPAKPADTLKRKYGDCKDKASLLVAMLRQAGIPAYLALLSAGPGQDVDPHHPGFGLFDHAIVYVPGSPDLWIDATAEYFQTGFLPSSDQGRLALIVKPETTDLTLIPQSPSSADHEIETREFFLPDYGKGRVVETSEGVGNADASFRAEYGSADTDQQRKDLSKYMRDEYISDASVKIDHPKGDDFSRPFRLRLEIDNSTRGSVSQIDGAVGVPLGALFANLPNYFKTAEKKPNADDAAKPAKKRTADFVLMRSFITEWRYRIHMPAGFHALKLPDAQNLQFGPTHFTSHFQTQDDDILAEFKFDTVKRRFSAEEGAQLKKELTAFLAQPVMLIRFEPVGRTLLSAGKVREAIEQFKAMATRFPNKSVYRVQLSSALMESGFGHTARAEAQRAVEIDPKSALVYQNLGWILLHDLVGRSFAKGFDAAGAEKAYRKASELDPKEALDRRNLAVILEHDAEGRRYESPDRLNEAIKIYREMGDDLASSGLTANLLYDLTYTRRFQELRSEAQKLALTDQTMAFKLVATSQLENTQAALKELEAETSDEATKSSALLEAAAMLLRLREYPAAADMFAAGAKGSKDSAQTMNRANLIRMLKRVDDLPAHADSPEKAMKLYLKVVFGSQSPETMLRQLTAREASVGLTEADWRKRTDKFRVIRRGLLTASGLSNSAVLDFMLSLIQLKTDRNGEEGYRVLMSGPGLQAQPVFVVHQENEFRVLADDSEPEGLGRRVLDDIKKGDLESAKRWLDWMRDVIKIAGGDDPLGGPVFPRIWVKGAQPDTATMRLAAAALLTNSRMAKDAIPILREAMESGKDDQTKLLARIAFVESCLKAKEYSLATPAAATLAQGHPESIRAANLLYVAYQLSGQWNDLERFANERLKLDAEDRDASRYLVSIEIGRAKFSEAESMARKMAEAPKGDSSDWNRVGWMALFAGDVTQEKIDLVLRAANNRPAVVHTVAAMYADLGKNSEARETALSVMQGWGIEEPNGDIWLIFGRMAERLGIKEEALADYAKIEPDEMASPEASYALAKRWLARIQK